MDETLVGKRVRLIEMDDEFAPPIDTEGTIQSVGTMTGLIDVIWDNGSTLSLIPDIDTYKILD